MATDGLWCSTARRSSSDTVRGVLRYEDKLSRQPTTARDTERSAGI
jgi:hypothetical protein